MPGYGDRIYLKNRRKYNPWLFVGIAGVVIIGLWMSLRLFNRSDSTSATMKDLTPMQKPSGEAGQTANGTKDTGSDSISIPDASSLSELQLETNDIFGNSDPNARAAMTEAVKLFYEFKFEEAIPTFTLYADSNPYALFMAGLSYYYLNDYPNALSCLSKSTQIKELAPLMFDCNKIMAFIYYKQDDVSSSLECANAALEIKRDNELEILRSKLTREDKVMSDYMNDEKEHFRIQFSKIEHQAIKETVTIILNDAYRIIGNQMDYYPEQIISVILYNEQNFFDITRAPGWAGGLYDGKIRIPINGVEGNEEQLRIVLFHEYTHAVIASITPHCPWWLNEGLAQYFSLGKDEKKIGQVIPLNYLESGIPDSNPRVVEAAYIESYSLVCYLFHRYTMNDVINLLYSYRRGEDSKIAFESVLLIDYDNFIKTWGKN